MFLLDTMVAWCDIENCIEMSQLFCPGLSVVLEVIDVLLPVITDVINLSFESRKFALAWREVLVRPLLKKVVPRLRLRTFLLNLSFESRKFALAWKEALVRPLLKKVVSRLRIRTFLPLATFLTSLNYQKRRQLFNSPIIWQLMACICSFNLHINNITALSRRC